MSKYVKLNFYRGFLGLTVQKILKLFVVIVIKQNEMNHVRILYSGINQIIGLKYFLWRPG